jgi:succinate-semialdehyde dehydrogenase/glutarate-semialdehyde dehydrogenase
MVARKLAPSLAAGCSVVLKPAPQTPFSALALADLASRAGVPAGVLNVVTGDAAIIGTALTGDHRVSFVSFTGSTAVGRLLMRQSAPTVKKLGLELGGHAPFIVLADADLDAAATGAFAAKFRNMGQTCVCPNRFFVHESVRAGFMDRLSSHVAGLVTGDGTDPATTQGPLVNTAALAKVEAHVADALAHGARLVCGGTRDPLGGTWYRPTILDGVTDAMLVAQEETFGPVAAISGYDDLDAVIATVNRAPYGLAAYVYGRDLSTILRTAERLDCGMVGLNAVHLGLEMAPIGGTKQSGLGREGSRHGLLDYCEMQYLLVGV